MKTQTINKQQKNTGAKSCVLLFTDRLTVYSGLEGLTVGAGNLGGVCLVSSDLNLVQRAVVFTLAVVCALSNGASNALVSAAGSAILLIVHHSFLRLSVLHRFSVQIQYLQLSRFYTG